jgi:hypothetical protein
MARVVLGSMKMSHSSSLSNSENWLAGNPALTWCPGQWHPASDQHQVLGATDLGFVRSVLESADCSLFDRDLESDVEATDAVTGSSVHG